MGAQKQTKKSKSYPLKVSRAVYNNGKIHECVKYMEFVQELKQPGAQGSHKYSCPFKSIPLIRELQLYRTKQLPTKHTV